MRPKGEKNLHKVTINFTLHAYVNLRWEEDFTVVLLMWPEFGSFFIHSLEGAKLHFLKS